MVQRFATCVNICLSEGVFPEKWKRANLVLIPKEGKVSDSILPKVRPICLLDETGKTLESDRGTPKLLDGHEPGGWSIGESIRFSQKIVNLRHDYEGEIHYRERR